MRGRKRVLIAPRIRRDTHVPKQIQAVFHPFADGDSVFIKDGARRRQKRLTALAFVSLHPARREADSPELLRSSPLTRTELQSKTSCLGCGRNPCWLILWYYIPSFEKKQLSFPKFFRQGEGILPTLTHEKKEDCPKALPSLTPKQKGESTETLRAQGFFMRKNDFCENLQ
jgi:hypothetical protein